MTTDVVGTKSSAMVTRCNVGARPDPRRVAAMLFVPGEELPAGESRAVVVVERIMAMSDAEVTATLADLRQRFAGRHYQLEAIWLSHFELARRRLGTDVRLSPDRAQLAGAYFTNEYALEAAALFNPSIVSHPDQGGLAPGDQRFVMSLRAVGEGHMSSIEFRTGKISAAAEVTLDDPGPFAVLGQYSAGPYNRSLFHAKLADAGCDAQAADLILGRLGAQFGLDELEAVIAALHPELHARAALRYAIEQIRWVAASNYTVEFSSESRMDERVLWPHGPSELQGMEDARFVRFVDDDGAVTYLGTYTAFDGSLITPQLLSTYDFRRFAVKQLAGPYATNKGMALFPRKIAGRYVSLSRWDRESLAVTMSDDGHDWRESTTLQWPLRPWELVQVGNCGSPIETTAGWLVLTHGVGPMREYSIGAILLDIDDPRRVIGSLDRPLLAPNEAEREGYVPNVVYSCGGLVHGESLLLPYGFSDSAIGFAVVDLNQLVDQLTTRG